MIFIIDSRFPRGAFGDILKNLNPRISLSTTVRSHGSTVGCFCSVRGVVAVGADVENRFVDACLVAFQHSAPSRSELGYGGTCAYWERFLFYADVEWFPLEDPVGAIAADRISYGRGMDVFDGSLVCPHVESLVRDMSRHYCLVHR